MVFKSFNKNDKARKSAEKSAKQSETEPHDVAVTLKKKLQL